MKKKLILGAAALPLVLAAAAAPAAPSNAGWYGDVTAGDARLHQSSGGLDAAFANQGLTTSTGLDRGHAAFGLHLGYRFNENWALEGGYENFGTHNFGSTVTAPAADTLSGSYRAHAWSFAPVGILPLNDRWALFGKVGLTENRARLSVASNTGATAPAGVSHSNAGYLFGGGATYDFSRSVYGTLEMDRYARIGTSASTGRTDANLLSVGVGVRF